MRLWLTLAFLASPAFALTTAYVSFDHPEGWKCELNQGVWICQSSVETDRKESVVLSIATMASEWDSLDNYEKYLKESRTIQDEDGSTLTSNVKYARRRNINGVVWVDSLQFNSELPGFWARYLATVHTTGQTKLAILITYIVSEERYKQLAPAFERMVASLKPNSEFNLNIATKQGDGPLPGSQIIGQVQRNIIADRLSVKRKTEDKKVEAPAGDNTMLLAAGGGAIVVLLLIMRIRRRRKAAKDNQIEPSKKAS